MVPLQNSDTWSASHPPPSFLAMPLRIHDLLDLIKLYSCNQDFAWGLEPKIKIICSKKLQLGGMLSKRMQFKRNMDGGLRAKPLIAEHISQFL